MDKPQKPTDLLPESFGGQKENFSEDLQSTGYQPDVPDILGGANLNYMLDSAGKNFKYNNAISDFVNGLPINKSITTDVNNKLVYTEYGIKVYNSSETYTLNEWVLGEVNDEKSIYQSLIADNTGNALTDETKWKKLELNDYSEIIQSLQNKMDKDMSNSTQPYVTETYVNGTSGYRVWSDGYCIQWGYSGWTLNPSSTTSISLFKNFSNTDYYITIGTDRAATGSSQIEMASIYSKSTGSFVIGSQQYVASEAVAGCWLAMGYLALGQY